MGLFGRFRGQTNIDWVTHVSLDENVFNNEGFKNGTQVWYTREGDGVGLYYYSIAPDLPRNQTIQEVN